jgi:transposase
MAYREVSVVEIKEVLRLWLSGYGYRPAARMSGTDRKTVRRYAELAQELGVNREGGEEQLSEELIGAMASKLQPGPTGGRGESWHRCETCRQELEQWVAKGLRLTKVHELLERKLGEEVPYRTLHRFATEELGFGKRKTTIRVDDCEPGEELQLDFGRMGWLTDAETGQRRKVWALIFTAVYSRHVYVWLTHRQQLKDVVEGFERAWEFFEGVFHVVIPDNMKAIVVNADPVDPKLTEGFIDYMQARGFFCDPARVRSAKDKPRVERAVPYVRESFFEGEEFRSLEQAQEQAERWCLTTAGLRDHGTTHRQPLVVFEEEEKGKLEPAPTERYDVPVFDDVTVHSDQHIVIGKALYSVPVAYVGEEVHVRLDSQLVRIYHRRQLIKLHDRQPVGGRSSDPGDFPEHKAIYATRDGEALRQKAEAAGPSVAEYARRLLDSPEPWRRMRALYRLLGLVHRYGADPVDRACGRALDLDVVDVKRVERIVRKGLEGQGPPEPPPTAENVIELRFARPASHFAIDTRPSSVEEGDHEQG